MRQLWDGFGSLGASVPKDSVVTVGPKSHVFGSVLGCVKETNGGFMSHVENFLSWRGWGVA